MIAFRVREFKVGGGFSVHPVAGISLFLLAFVISAVISGSLVLAYPAVLFFDGRRREALRVVFWSAAWLIAICLLVALAAFLAIAPIK